MSELRSVLFSLSAFWIGYERRSEFLRLKLVYLESSSLSDSKYFLEEVFSLSFILLIPPSACLASGADFSLAEWNNWLDDEVFLSYLGWTLSPGADLSPVRSYLEDEEFLDFL